MNTPFKRIGLFIRKEDAALETAVIQVCEFLKSRSLKVFCNEPLSFLPSLEVISIAEFPSKCDLTIAIGGDGTMLSASRALAGFELPVVGINIGRLGFWPM